jgi:O-antigen/teichoic acid export membrane protein
MTREDILDTPEAGPRVIRGSVLRVGGYVLGVVFGVASSALMFRHLGVVDTGRYVTVLALIAIVGGVSDLGLTSIGVREYTVRSGADRERFLRNLIGMRTVFTLVGGALAVVFGLVSGYTHEMVLGTALAAAGYTIFIYGQALSTPLQAQLRLGWVTLIQLLAQAGQAIGTAVLVVAGAGLVAFLSLQIPVMLPLAALTGWLVHRYTPLLPAFDLAAWRSLMRDILPYAGAVVLAVLYFRLAAILVSLLSSPRETGYFAVAFRVVDTLTLIPPLLVSAAFPVLARAARDDRDRFDYAVTRLTQGMVLAGAWFGICLVVGAELAVDVVAGPGFEPSVEVLRLMGAALVGNFLVATSGYALLSLRRHRAILVSNLVALIVAASLGVWLIDAEGARGAAISLTVAELTLAVGNGIALIHARPAIGRAAATFPRVALAAAGALAVALVPDLPALPALVIATLVYGAIVAATGALPWEIRHALVSPLRSGRERNG